MRRRRAWRRIKAAVGILVGVTCLFHLVMVANIERDTHIPNYNVARPILLSNTTIGMCCLQDTLGTRNVTARPDTGHADNVTDRIDNAWTYNITDRQRQHIDRVHDVCNTVPPRKFSLWKQVPTFYISRQLSVSYCLLSNEVDDFFAGVFDVLNDRLGTNETYIDTLLTKTTRNDERKRITYFNRLRKSSKTVLFVSNPYERLLVGYIDEVYLAVNDCENMTFQAFLDRVISGVKLRLNYGVNLFPPIVPGCRVCGLAVIAVVRRETMAEDIGYTFQQLQLPREKARAIVHYTRTPELHILPMIQAKLRLRKVDKCPPSPDLGTKLWRSFQIMGTLPAGSAMPREFIDFDHSIHVRRLAKAMVRAALDNVLTAEAADTQRRRYLADAYSGIKAETTDYITEIYKYDFELFGYDNQLPMP